MAVTHSVVQASDYTFSLRNRLKISYLSRILGFNFTVNQGIWSRIARLTVDRHRIRWVTIFVFFIRWHICIDKVKVLFAKDMQIS